MFQTIDRVIVWTTASAIVLLMGCMVVGIVLGVFFRYVVNAALPWPEEFARFAMIWVTMLGSGLVLRYSGHIAVTFLAEALPPRVQIVLAWIGRLLVAAFLALMFVKGIEMTQIVARQTAPAMQISMSIPNLSLPVGAFLMLYHLVVVSVAPHLRSPTLFGRWEEENN
jgi:TRAP-type C4-dicarboxylate transport system permease small subunit